MMRTCCGRITGLDYARAIGFGAGVGALAAFAPNSLIAALAGGVGGAGNTTFNQMMMQTTLDPTSITNAALAGLAGGFLAGELQQAGQMLTTIPRGLLGPQGTLEIPGAAVGTAIGTVVGSM